MIYWWLSASVYSTRYCIHYNKIQTIAWYLNKIKTRDKSCVFWLACPCCYNMDQQTMRYYFNSRPNIIFYITELKEDTEAAQAESRGATIVVSTHRVFPARANQNLAIYSIFFIFVWSILLCSLPTYPVGSVCPVCMLTSYNICIPVLGWCWACQSSKKCWLSRVIGKA